MSRLRENQSLKKGSNSVLAQVERKLEKSRETTLANTQAQQRSHREWLWRGRQEIGESGSTPGWRLLCHGSFPLFFSLS